MNTECFKGKRVLIFQQRGWGTRVGHFLAKKLQDEGCRLAAVTIKKSVHTFISNQREVRYEHIIDYDDIIDFPKRYLGNDNYSLQEICDDLGIDSVWVFVQSLRHHVRSYKEKYYYSYRQEATDDEIIDYVKAVYKSVKHVFTVFNPELIIAPNIASLFHIFYNLYGKKFGVKMIRATESRVRGVCILVHDYNEGGGRFYDRLQQLQAGAQSQNFEKAKQYIQRSGEKLIIPLHSDNVLKKDPTIKRIRYHLAPYRKIYRYYFGNKENRPHNIKVTIDDLSPWYIMRDYITHTRNLALTRSFPYADFSEIKKYIYFPLQFQPEETIDVLAPRFNNQIEVIRQVAMSAPGDYTVVVKEHPTMVGLRSPSYMDKIARTPNVKLIDYRIPSEEVIRRSDLVVSLSGTSLSEAAFLRKPAIQFGNLELTKKLPNVFCHSDFTTLTKKIQETLTINLKTDEYDRSLLHFVAAAYDVSSSADYIGLWIGKTPKEKIGDQLEKLWGLYKNEIIYVFNKTNS